MVLRDHKDLPVVVLADKTLQLPLHKEGSLLRVGREKAEVQQIGYQWADLLLALAVGSGALPAEPSSAFLEVAAVPLGVEEPKKDPHLHPAP